MHRAPTPADDTLLIGEIVAAFGIRGQMKMRSYTDNVEHLRRRVRSVFLGPERQEYALRGVIAHKPGMLVVSLEGVTTRTEAEELSGSEVAIRESDAPPLAQGEYFIHDLYGLLVVTEAGEEIGRVREVISTGANEVLVVPRQGQPEALIPVIHDVVQDLDIPSGRVVIRVIEGLFD